MPSSPFLAGVNTGTNDCRLSEVVEQISRKKIPDHQKNVILEITCEDATEEDVEVPYVMLKLNK